MTIKKSPKQNKSINKNGILENNKFYFYSRRFLSFCLFFVVSRSSSMKTPRDRARQGMGGSNDLSSNNTESKASFSYIKE